MTDSERQSIVSSVLQSLATNSRLIDQLTPVTSLADTDKLELSGGKYITYADLKAAIISLFSLEECDSSAQAALNTLVAWKAALTDKYHVVNIWDAGTTENTYKFGFSAANNITGAVGDYQYIEIPAATDSKAGVMTAGTFNNIATLSTWKAHFGYTAVTTGISLTGSNHAQVAIKEGMINPDTLVRNEHTITLPTVSTTAAGVMTAAQYQSITTAISDNTTAIAEVAEAATANASAIAAKIVEFAGFTENPTIQTGSIMAEPEAADVVFDTVRKMFLTYQGTKTYMSWPTKAAKFPLRAKTIYVDVANNTTYRYDGTTLVRLNANE